MESLKEFIESCVDFDGLGYDQPKENTIECAAVTLFDECVKHDRRPKKIAAKFTEALQGLPSYINVPFMNYEIVNLVYALGLDFDRNDDDQCTDAIEAYWNACGEILAEAYMKYQPV